MRSRLLGFGAALSLGVALALACGSTPIESYRSKAGPPDAALDGRDPDAIEVPPDRARIPVLVAVVGDGTFASTADALRARIDALGTALGDAPGCAVEVRAYHPPAPYDDGWSARAELEMDVAFAELPDVRARMDRLDACAAVLAERLADRERIDEHLELTITSGAAGFEVDAPETHLSALAERAARRLQAAAAIGGAPQLHPEDRRCVPTGRVLTGRASIADVDLVLEMACTQASGPTPQG